MTQTGSMGLISAALPAAPQAVHHIMGIPAPLHKPTPAGLRVPKSGVKAPMRKCDAGSIPTEAQSHTKSVAASAHRPYPSHP